MSEILISASEPYQPPRQSSGYGTRCKIGAVVCVLLIVGMIIIAMVFWGGITGGSSYQTRSLTSYNNLDVDIFPSYLYDEFDVISSEVQTTTSPDVHFIISVVSTGVDSVSVWVHFAIYEINQTTFDSISTWPGRETYLVGIGDYLTSRTASFNLENYASTYVWVIWFDAPSKTDVWTVDIDLTLRYNSNV